MVCKAMFLRSGEVPFSVCPTVHDPELRAGMLSVIVQVDLMFSMFWKQHSFFRKVSCASWVAAPTP
jgi:hypothetical protein